MNTGRGVDPEQKNKRNAPVSLSAFLTRLALFCAVPAMLMAIFLAGEQVMEARRDLDSDGMAVARSVAAALDEQLHSRIAGLSLLANSPLADHPQYNWGLYKDALGFKESFGSDVILADRQMQMLFHTGAPQGAALPVLVKAEGRDAPRIALETEKPAVGDTLVGAVIKDRLVAVALPVRRGGQTIALLVSPLRAAQFERHLKNAGLPAGWSLAVLDSQGAEIARRLPAYELGTDSAAPKRFIYGLGEAPWSVVVEIPHSLYLKPLLSSAFGMGAALLGIVLVSAFLGRKASRCLADSVASLSGGVAPDSCLEIVEISAVRQRLEESARLRNLASARQQASEERLRLVLDVASDGFWDWDVPTDRVYRSPGYFKVVGRSPDEDTGDLAFFVRLVHPDDQQRVMAATDRYRQGSLSDLEMDFRVAHGYWGGVRWIRSRARTVGRDVDGKPLRILGTVTDITEQKQAEIALAESEARVSAIIGSARDAIVVADHSQRIILFNPAAEAMFGYRAADIVGTPIHRLVPDRYRVMHIESVAAFATSQGDMPTFRIGRELMGMRADGTEFPIEISVSATTMGEGRLFVAVVRDITDRRRVEQALRDSHAFSLAILNSVAAEIAVLDQHGFIIAVNKAWQQFAEDNAAQPGQTVAGTEVGANYLAVCESGTCDLSSQAACRGIEAVLARRLPFYEQEYSCDSPTSRRWFKLSVTPLDMDGGVVVSHTDVTALRQAMAELRLTEERLRLAQQGAGLGIYDFDVATDRVVLDERIRDIHGITDERPVSMTSLLADVHTDDLPALGAAIERASQPGSDGSLNVDCRIVNRLDGAVHYIEASGRFLFDGGRAVRAVGTVRDVTAQKRLERELQDRRNEMDALVKQQVAIHTAAAIAHELNQPLVAVSAYSEAALRMLHNGAQTTDKKFAHALESAATQAQRAGKKLHQLIAFMHKGKVAAEAFDLNDLVNESLALAEEGGYGGFHSRGDLEPALRPVLANRMQVQKVLVNLLHNGVEAMRTSGLKAPAITITVRTHDEGKMAQVTVRDSGPGFDKLNAAQIFEPFVTTKNGGLGLGLAISRALIEAHGGQLWADPEAGPGATFHFTLPFAG